MKESILISTETMKMAIKYQEIFRPHKTLSVVIEDIVQNYIYDVFNKNEIKMKTEEEL